LVTAACFWYVFRQIDLAALVGVLPTMDARWALLALAIAVLQIPLVALRLDQILAAIAARSGAMTYRALLSVTAISQFFMQVLPNVAGEGVRAWLLRRLGCDWKDALIGVLLDRGVGVGLLVALSFVLLLLPSAFIALGGYRDLVVAIYGAALLAGVLGLVLVPYVVPWLERWRYSRWIAEFAAAARRALLGRRSAAILGIAAVVHVLTIAIVWSLARAQGLTLPMVDAAVLFCVMLGVALVPISVGGWGLRELAVVSLLGQEGVAPERALLFSICFGIVVAAAALPGAVVWLVQRAPRAPQTDRFSSCA
jgi:uncharacterized membrane protein YbhN (UPF0104 family)